MNPVFFIACLRVTCGTFSHSVALQIIGSHRGGFIAMAILAGEYLLRGNLGDAYAVQDGKRLKPAD